MRTNNTPNGTEGPPAARGHAAADAAAPSPTTGHAPSSTSTSTSTNTNCNNPPAANAAPSPTVPAPPPIGTNNLPAANETVAPRALSNDESIELRKLLKATLKIDARMSIATEEQDEEDAILLLDYAMDLVEDGESVGHIAGELLLLELSVFDASTVDDFEECLSSFLGSDTPAVPRPSVVHGPYSTQANNSPTAIIAPPSPTNPTSSTSNDANKGWDNQANGLELIDDHGPPLPIGTIEAQLDEAELGGKPFAKPSGKLEQIKDDEGPHHASTALAASLEVTNKSPARRHVEIINDNAAPINPFDSTAGEFATPSGKLEQIEDDEGPSENSFAVLAASLEATDKGADKRHVETMNDDAAPTPFNSTEFDDIQTDKINAKAQNMDAHGHEGEPASIESSMDVIEGGDDIETGFNLGACEGGVGITPPVNPTHRGDSTNDVANEEDGGANMNSTSASNNVMEAIATNRESQSAEMHVAQAYAVEGSDQEVVIATRTPPSLPWWKQRRVKLFLTAMFVVMTAMAIALGVSMSSSSSVDGEPLVVVVERTNAPSISPSISQTPTISIQPSASLVPTSTPSVSLRPSVHPSLPPTTTPSQSPSITPSQIPSQSPTTTPSPTITQIPSQPPTTTQSPSFTRLESLKLVADDGAAYDQFGRSVAVFEDTLVVGARGDNDKGSVSGSAYIYNRDPTTEEWILQQKLVADDGADYDWFGRSVAIFEDTVVVGAYGDDDKGDKSGSAYIYHQDPETKEWILQQKLLADDGAADDYFGYSVTVFEDTVVVGARYDDTDKGDRSGSAYIYNRDPTTEEWILQQKLVADDGAAGDYFGWSVAIFEDTVVVGAYGDDDKGAGSGSAYIYNRDATTKEWILQQKLVADDGAAGDYFGSSVAVFGDTVVVGAVGDDDKGEDCGSAYIYHQDATTKEWILQQKLVADDGAERDYFGYSVTVFEDTVVLGAHYYDDTDKGAGSGSAYIYNRDPTTKDWILQQKLVADDGADGDHFGCSVAIYNSTVVVGAVGDDDKGAGSGSVYVYS